MISEKIQSAKNANLGRYESSILDKAEELLTKKMSILESDNQEVPAYVNSIIEKEFEIQLYYDKSYPKYEKALAAIAQYLAAHNA